MDKSHIIMVVTIFVNVTGGAKSALWPYITKLVDLISSSFIVSFGFSEGTATFEFSTNLPISPPILVSHNHYSFQVLTCVKITRAQCFCIALHIISKLVTLVKLFSFQFSSGMFYKINFVNTEI